MRIRSPSFAKTKDLSSTLKLLEPDIALHRRGGKQGDRKKTKEEKREGREEKSVQMEEGFLMRGVEKLD